MVKILVCGSRGSLMTHVVRNLLSIGHEVIGVDNESGPGQYDDYPDDYRIYNGDLRDYNVVWDIVTTEKPEVIIQAAALVYGARGLRLYPADILSTEVEITSNLLRASNHFLRKFVYLSSSMIYESAPIPHIENMPTIYPPKKTYYGFSKMVGEQLVRAYAEQYDIEYTIWRPFNIIDPDEISTREDGIFHVYSDYLRKILVVKQNPLEIFGDGNQTRTFTWVGDASYVISKHLLNPMTKNEAFNIAGEQNVSMRQLARLIRGAGVELGVLPKKYSTLQFKTIGEFETEVRDRIPKINKIQKLLYFKETIPLETLIEVCIKNLIKKNVLISTRKFTEHSSATQKLHDEGRLDT